MKRSAIQWVALLILTATAMAFTVFYDNFDLRKNEWQQIRGNWRFTGGFLSQTSADPRHLNSLIFIDHPQVADATIETLVRVRPGGPRTLTGSMQDQRLLADRRNIIGAGLIFGMRDQNNFYMFRLAGEEGAVLGKMVNGQWIDIANPRAGDYLRERVKFSGSNWYRLKVRFAGNRITCYVNDSAVINSTDDTFGLGRVGLCTFKTGADFDFIRITR